MNLNVSGKIRQYFGYNLLKLFVVMKLTMLIIIVCCLGVSANTFSQTITLQAKNKPLEDVLKAIGKQSKHFFFYRYDDVKGAPPVTVNLNNATLEEALRACLKNQPFEYEVENKTIVINKKPIPA